MSTMRRIALALVIIGAINWGLIGFFQFDLVASLFGGQDSWLSRLIYALVGLSGLVCLGLLFSTDDAEAADRMRPARLNYNTEFAEEPSDIDEDPEDLDRNRI